MTNQRTVGSQWEEKAATFLESKGLTILCKNFRCRQGEIDLIARQDAYLVFVEVKYRTSKRQGFPGEAVDFRKQKTICKVADYYRMKQRIGEFTPIRYDVVSFCGAEMEWIQDAFPHHY